MFSNTRSLAYSLLTLGSATLLVTGCNKSSQPKAQSQEPTQQAVGADSFEALDANLSNFDYPFEVKTFTFTSQQQELSMAYMDVMPEEGVANGKTALLLHGKNFSGAYWETTAQALTKQGYRVVIPDQIGFGKSTKPQHYQYTFQALADNTDNLLKSLNINDNILVVGHSMGGMLATRYSLMYPEKVTKLALVNPIGLEDWKLKVPYVPVGTWYKQELQKTPEKIKNYMTASYFDNAWKPEYDELLAIQAGWSKHKEDYPLVAWNSALTYDMIFTQPVLYEFDQLTMPTLLILGDRDRTALGKNLVEPEVAATMGLYDKLGEITCNKIPQCTHVELPGIGHIPQYESFDEYIKALVNFSK